MKKLIFCFLIVFCFFHLNAAFCQPPQQAKAFKDLVYAKHGDQEMKLDLYIPEEGDGPFPLVVWIHGGGWIGGDKNDCPVLNLGYCRRGYATASLSYRFSNVAPFPAQLEDVKAAIRWLRAHAKEYKLDPTRVGVIGASAGGHLVCLLGVTGKTKQFDVGDNLDQSSEVQAVCNIFGPTDLLTGLDGLDPDTDLTKALIGMISGLLGGPMEEKTDVAKMASSTTYVDADAAPFMHVHGTKDLLVPVEQAEKLHDKLRQANVPSRLFIIPQAGHGDGIFNRPEIFKEIELFFDRNLKKS